LDLEQGNEFWNRVRVRPGSWYKSLFRHTG